MGTLKARQDDRTGSADSTIVPAEDPQWSAAPVPFVPAGEQPLTLELVIASWLDAKHTRSGSAKTLRAYRDTLARFREALQAVGLDVDSPIEEHVATVLQAWAGAAWRGDGRPIKPATRSQRLAIISSFYQHARRKRFKVRDTETGQLRLITSPLDMVERPPVESTSAGYLEERDIAARLDAINTTTPIGQRDLALLWLGLQTGRRLSELAALQWGNITFSDHDGAAEIAWPRLKGGKTGTSHVEPEVAAALRQWHDTLAAEGEELVTRKSPVWISLAHNGTRGHQLRTDAIADLCQRRLGSSKVHMLRHSFAYQMLKVGAPVTAIQTQLGHKNVATTQRYLGKMDTRNRFARQLVERFGGHRVEQPAEV